MMEISSRCAILSFMGWMILYVRNKDVLDMLSYFAGEVKTYDL
jgi:hypothetical protein